MVEFALPRNSRPTPGKVWPKPAGANNVREFRVYRWTPEDGQNPRIDTYFVNLDDCGPMVLDAIIWIKKQRRSNPYIPPLMPRRYLRIMRDEY